MSLVVAHSLFAAHMPRRGDGDGHGHGDDDDAHSRAMDATSTDPWGPSHALMEQLCQFTHTRHCADVLHVLHDALNATGAQWRRVLKALTTLAHCLRRPSPEMTLFATAHRALIRRLTQFEYVDTYRLDRGAAVREEAQVVVELMQHRIGDAPISTPTPASVPGPSSATTHAHAPRRHPTLASPSPGPSVPPGPLFPTHPATIFAQPPWHPAPPPRNVVQESIHDSTTLDALISHLESLPAPTNATRDDLWLNIYKLLFLLNTSLPTASDDMIQYWVWKRALLGRVGREAERCAGAGATLASRRRGGDDRSVGAVESGGGGGSDTDSVAWEVKRLARELGSVLEGTAPAEVRRRARRF